MAMCSIINCGKQAKARGWCDAHWARWRRHGTPLGGRDHAAARAFFDDVVLPYQGQGCLIWPHGKSGSGAALLYQDDGMKIVARIVCEVEHGPAPSSDHEAAHECGNGHLGCVARRHLSWKTHAENMADMVVHQTSTRGVKNAMSKLSEESVLAIRSLKGKMLQKEIAELYGVSKVTVHRILRGERWGWLDVQN